MTNVLNQPGGIAEDIRDIKPPIELSSGLDWLWWAIAIVVVAAIAVLIFLLLKKRKTVTPVVPAVPAHVLAKQQLEQALALISQPEPFCVAVSGTVRWYLEERFTFRAPERTTEEFLHELRNTNLLLPDQKQSLGDFLQECDLVKFARYEPGEAELRQLHGSALRLIDETQPEENPVNSLPPPQSTAAPMGGSLNSEPPRYTEAPARRPRDNREN